METPSQCVSSFDHLVTQWMSTVTDSCGRARSSFQVQRLGCSTLPTMEKSHRSSGVCGVGPADNTGKPRSRYCPGGSRPATALSWRRPRKPRDMKLTRSPPDYPRELLNPMPEISFPAFGQGWDLYGTVQQVPIVP